MKSTNMLMFSTCGGEHKNGNASVVENQGYFGKQYN